MRINSCAVVATQCMHGSPSLAACCAFVRPWPSWRRRWVSTEERKLIPQLLEIFRSGALSSLLPIAPTCDSSSTNPNGSKYQTNINYTKAHLEKPADAARAGGWTAVKHAKVVTSESKDKLLPNGWSVPTKHSVSEMCSSEPRICLVSTAEARKRLKELKGEHPLAIVAPSNITNTGDEVHVLVEDPTGRWQTRRRFMIHLGNGMVSYMRGAPKKSVRADSLKIVLSLAKHHTDAETWAHAANNAHELTEKWLKVRAKVKFL